MSDEQILELIKKECDLTPNCLVDTGGYDESDLIDAFRLGYKHGWWIALESDEVSNG